MDKLTELIIVLVPMLLSLTIHEFAHAWTAFKLGDDTARRQGRLTLNPISHIDLVGTLLIPAFSVLYGNIGLIGWAKPVPVSPARFRRSITMHSGMLVTSLAGPASNILLALIFGGVLMGLFGDAINAMAPRADGSRALVIWALGETDPVLMILGRVFFLNITLAIFNMLPVPPLDGSRLLPFGIQESMAKYQLLVFLGLILLINAASEVLIVPMFLVGNAILGLFSIFF